MTEEEKKEFELPQKQTAIYDLDYFLKVKAEWYYEKIPKLEKKEEDKNNNNLNEKKEELEEEKKEDSKNEQKEEIKKEKEEEK